ncbi:hypothetical protein [[Erwinia] mediterraneensis]|uniref:hypothetical protein n=1 Tax=[Erwinia] mediterraneensis TaxID=2161819 RepID=UPI0030794FE2
MNPFCKADREGFLYWNGVDFLHFRAMPDNQKYLTGMNYLWACKSSWLVYNKDRILTIATQEKIPAMLLAGVAVAEVAGTPERLKG